MNVWVMLHAWEAAARERMDRVLVVNFIFAFLYVQCLLDKLWERSRVKESELCEITTDISNLASHMSLKREPQMTKSLIFLLKSSFDEIILKF